MRYEIYLSEEFFKRISKFSEKLKVDILNKIKEMEDKPKGKRLHGFNLYTLRIGKYRIIYKIDHSERKIYIVTIAHRKNIYDRYLK